MTKKMTNIVNKMYEKMETELWLAKKGFTNYKKFCDNTSRIANEYRQMLSGMYSYKLISEKDFEEAFGLASEKWCELLESYYK